MKYPKINTLWKRERNGKKKGCIIPGEYSEPEFESINRWLVTEKIDGTNLRILYDAKTSLSFGGKTDKAEIPPLLVDALKRHFNKEKFQEVFENAQFVILFGEGYGKKIQEPHGKKYISDKNDFILFDVWIDGYWLEYEDVISVAESFDIKAVPFIGVETIDDIIKRVKSKEISRVSEIPQVVEGYVCTSFPMMHYRDSRKPIRFKLKCSDYEKLKQKLEELS